MNTMNLRVVRWVVAAGLVAGCVVGAEMPAAPKMPPANPGKGGQPAPQPTPDQIKQMQREHERNKDKKPRTGNTQEPFGGGKKEKEKQKELAVTGVLEKDGNTSPGAPEAFTIKDAAGKGYSLEGKEITLRRLVGKSVEIKGELDQKTGVLKVKYVGEAKEKIGDKKATKI